MSGIARTGLIGDIDVPALSQGAVSKQPRYVWKHDRRLTIKGCAATCSGSFFV
jgi:hypothetical protein